MTIEPKLLTYFIALFKEPALTQSLCWYVNNFVHCWHSCRTFSHWYFESSCPFAFSCMHFAFSFWRWFFTQSFRKLLYL